MHTHKYINIYLFFFLILSQTFSKLSQLSQFSNSIILPNFYPNLTCSAVLKPASYPDFISKLIFHFLKLSQLSQILNLINFSNFYQNLTCSEVLKPAFYPDYISKLNFHFLKLSQLSQI